MSVLCKFMSLLHEFLADQMNGFKGMAVIGLANQVAVECTLKIIQRELFLNESAVSILRRQNVIPSKFL